MSKPNYSTAFTVDQSPEEVFAAITNPRRWWSGDIDGDTNRVGAVFTYHHGTGNGTTHRSTQRVTELVPGKRVAWNVVDSDLSFLRHREEWKGTDIIFDVSKKRGKTEVRFTHVGLAPEFECYDSCSSAWGMLINGNLRKLIATGEVQPDPFE
ncbi:MAG: SRPBCC family protein [Gemmatimonadota bacterium]